MHRFDKRRRLPLRWFFAMAAVGTIAMLSITWDTFVSRPETYRMLRARGVEGAARVHCSRDNCTLTYFYAGKRHENSYDNDHPQFRTPVVPVLVDPRHPSTMYTEHDVQHDTNAGLGVFGIFCLLVTPGLSFLTFWLGRALLEFVPITDLRLPPPARLPESRRQALLAIDATEDVLYDGRFPSRTTLRFDAPQLAGALSHLRERLAAVPGLDPRLLAIGDELARGVPAAGHLRLDPEPLFERLDALRRGVVIGVARS